MPVFEDSFSIFETWNNYIVNKTLGKVQDIFRFTN